MPGQIAPWLEDLDEDWLQPPSFPTKQAQPTHEDNSHTTQASRIPRRSSGAHSILSDSSVHMPQRRRNPLSELSPSAANASAIASLEKSTASKLPVSRSASRSTSLASVSSVVRYDTIERKERSTSPEKKQHTLEWKKRLIKGELGYGDQTDLFGPSPLENIFQSPSKQSDAANPESSRPMRKLFKQQDFPSAILPSSPPPWPSSIDFTAVSSPALQGTCRKSPKLDRHSQRLSQYGHGVSDREEDRQPVEEAQSLVKRREDEGQDSQYRHQEAQDIEDQFNYQDDPPSDDSLPNPHTSPSQLPGLGQNRGQSNMDRRFLQPSSCQPANRTISGQTDLSGEAFSPVFISKHTTIDGRIDYAAVDPGTPDALQLDHDSVNHGNGDEDEENDDDCSSVIRCQHAAHSDPFTHDVSLPTMPEDSLPENLPTGTPPVAGLNNFVSVKRGGLSAYGSFNHRPLSPSQSESLRQSNLSRQTASLTLSESPKHTQSDDASGDYGQSSPSSANSVRVTPKKLTTPIRPDTPTTKQESVFLSPPKTRPSTSPLKLFGNYDTFTNNRLLRRMSQLEDLEYMQENAGYNGAHRVSSIQEQPSSPVAGVEQKRPQRNIKPSLSSFGEGELDEHDFEADLSIPSALDFSDEYSQQGSPPPQVAPPGSRAPFRFHVEESQDAGDYSYHLKRKLSNRSTAKSRMSADRDSFDRKKDFLQESQSDQQLEGKRPRSSPSKAPAGPTPKRRRTIVALNGHLPDMGYGTEIQVKITGASTDGSRSTSFDDMNSWGREKRNVTRPRNPTPSQHRRQEIHDEVGEATLDFLSSSPRLEAVKETLDLTDIPEASLTAEQAKAVAAQVAAYTLNVTKSDSDGKRNRSITTQDFLDEAMHIMSLIRARGRPCSGLGSVEESDREDMSGNRLGPEDMQSLSPLRLSRPPSREGGSTGWRSRGHSEHDTRVISKLRKFQEDEDELNVVGSSLRSLNLTDLEAHAGQLVADDPSSNVRIRGPRPETRRSRGQSDVSHKSKGSGSPTKTHGSHPSLDSSSNRTVGTQSTRKSENVATLAPETVAHLIPEEVAGMTFDKDIKRWVRIKGGNKVQREPTNQPSQIASDDDPFNDIPDLTVDEMKELTRVALSPTKESFRSTTSELTTQKDNRLNSAETVMARPVTRDSQPALQFTSSSAPSKYSAFGSSQHQIDTRATSWSVEELAVLKRSKIQTTNTGHGLLDLASCNVPHPISDISEHIEEEDQSDDGSLSLDGSVTEELPAPKQRGAASTQPWYQSSPGSMYQGPPRPFSLRRQTLHRGLGGGVQDRSEMAFIATLPDKRLMSVSVNLSRTPARGQTSQDLIVPSSPAARGDATFYLSDLPDFTVNEADEERPSEKVLAKRIAEHEVGDRYAMAVQSLVKTLTDVEPDEPYWEDIKQLSLRDRDLCSVHNLEDFCTRLEDLDLANNNIAHLEGAPHTIRRLNVSSNSLSSLTAWSHLMNLQYLDISGNSIDSLAGLCMLVHLREVRADDNHIHSLDGIMGLDGLLKLSVRRNSLTTVDFEGCQLKRLEELDLSGNQLTEVHQAESLTSLSRFILDYNELTDFAAGVSDSHMTCLSLRNNRLESLDVSRCVGLRYLNIDENRLTSIQGIERLQHLDVLAMRKQACSKPTLGLAILEQQIHARSLYLSSNAISDLQLPQYYHSVQNLELASCGLQSLPADFGLRFPNLRTLNLSFNALKDLRPLLNIPQLQTLYVPGNRISRLRKTVATIARMQHLRHFDARDNPFTLGFYPPTATVAALTAASERSLVSTTNSSDCSEQETDAQIQKRVARSYVLAAGNRVLDSEHCGRLDEESRLRRRVYELLLSQSSRSLVELDGLAFEREKVVVRDEVWDRLIELGVMRKSTSASKEEGLRVEGSPVCELEV